MPAGVPTGEPDALLDGYDGRDAGIGQVEDKLGGGLSRRKLVERTAPGGAGAGLRWCGDGEVCGAEGREVCSADVSARIERGAVDLRWVFSPGGR